MAHTVIWMKPTRVKKATGRHWVISVKPSQEPSCGGERAARTSHSTTMMTICIDKQLHVPGVNMLFGVLAKHLATFPK